MANVDIVHYSEEITAELMSLLLAADPDEGSILAYLPDSPVLVAKEGGSVVGVAVLVNTSKEFELKNIAVSEEHQGRGVAKRLIKEVKALAISMGAEELLVGTGNSSLSQLALYQKCGFRMSHIERDYFLSYPEPIYENGMQCRDLVVLRAKLGEYTD